MTQMAFQVYMTLLANWMQVQDPGLWEREHLARPRWRLHQTSRTVDARTLGSGYVVPGAGAPVRARCSRSQEDHPASDMRDQFANRVIQVGLPRGPRLDTYDPGWWMLRALVTTLAGRAPLTQRSHLCHLSLSVHLCFRTHLSTHSLAPLAAPGSSRGSRVTRRGRRAARSAPGPAR